MRTHKHFARSEKRMNVRLSLSLSPPLYSSFWPIIGSRLRGKNNAEEFPCIIVCECGTFDAVFSGLRRKHGHQYRPSNGETNFLIYRERKINIYFFQLLLFCQIKKSKTFFFVLFFVCFAFMCTAPAFFPYIAFAYSLAQNFTYKLIL